MVRSSKTCAVAAITPNPGGSPRWSGACTASEVLRTTAGSLSPPLEAPRGQETRPILFTHWRDSTALARTRDQREPDSDATGPGWTTSHVMPGCLAGRKVGVMNSRWLAAMVVVLGMVGGGCAQAPRPVVEPIGDPADPTSPTSTDGNASPTVPGSAEGDEVPPGDDPTIEPDDRPPPVTIRYDGQSHDLAAWTYCFGMVCSDGIAPQEPHAVGSPGQVVVEFPLDDWEFTASFEEVGPACPAVHDAELEARGDGTHVLAPAGTPGTYDVTLFGRGDGDLFVTFRWTTPVEGPMNAPEASVAVLADHDGRLDSDGVEMSLGHVASTPTAASATITVLDGDGDELTTVELDQSDSMLDQGDGDCAVAGNLVWARDVDATGLTSAQWQEIPLDDGPFTYEVELVLDGTVHTATATWPDDTNPEIIPHVPLGFTPPLPAR